jgi:UDP-2,4-diacetamido-2,4,6-trideoxy-beta-L-altropyranose hydrolase
MRIFIRADGGGVIGLGHIMRMLVLAKELRKTNKVIFICKSSSSENSLKKVDVNNYSNFDFKNDKFKAGIEKVIENGFEVLIIRDEHTINDIIELQKDYNAELIITDSYDVGEEYFNKLKAFFKICGYMDDVNKCKMNVDFIINQNINAEEIDYKSNINKYTKLFLGTKYCLLREEFRENYNKKIIKEKAEDVLLTLGGMDRDYNTVKILNEIANCNVTIHVVIGGAFDGKLIKELYGLSKDFCNVKVYENANMSALMKKCDIAISACGSTLYELCAMNVPTIGIIIADNQELVAKKMKEKFLIEEAYYIDGFKKGDLKSSLNKLINDDKLRSEIINNQCNVVNVNGVKNLAAEINKLNLLR